MFLILVLIPIYALVIVDAITFIAAVYATVHIDFGYIVPTVMSGILFPLLIALAKVAKDVDRM